MNSLALESLENGIAKLCVSAPVDAAQLLDDAVLIKQALLEASCSRVVLRKEGTSTTMQLYAEAALLKSLNSLSQYKVAIVESDKKKLEEARLFKTIVNSDFLGKIDVFTTDEDAIAWLEDGNEN